MILELVGPRALHLIDPWEVLSAEYQNTYSGKERNRAVIERNFDIVTERFLADPRVHIHRGYSTDILRTMPDASLDWIYIDGNHNYETVKADIESGLRVVKPNGWITGDDLFWGRKSGKPVQTAVREAVAQLGDAVAYSRIGQQYVLKLQRA